MNHGRGAKQPKIPYHRASIGCSEIDEVVDTLTSGWLTTGPKTARFEDEFGAYVDAPHCMGVNSCTAALHLALSAMGVGPGDEVITTPLTFCATVNTILHTGASVVLADIGDDGNISPQRIDAAITPRTKAIVPVHFAGHPCEMDAIWELARQHGLYVLEDAAHAVGTTYQGTPIGGRNEVSGGCSDAVAFSFYATKNLTTGEGGMVTTHNKQLAEKMRSLCLHGINRDAWNRYSEKGKWHYQVTDIGYKYNLSDILSSIGIHQLRRQEEFIARRTEIAQRYIQAFSRLPELSPPACPPTGRHSWHLFVLRLNLDSLGIDRNEFIQELDKEGVQCSVHFIPITLHPAYRQHPNVISSSVFAAEAAYQSSLSLPLYPAMTDDEVESVIRAVCTTVSTHRRKAWAAAAGA